MDNTAITVWIDESEIRHNGKVTWIIGQLITSSDEDECDFLKELKGAHRTARTWDTLHACEFSSREKRRWALLTEWLRIFKESKSCLYHAFVFDESNIWRDRFSSPSHYWAHQICFGLGNKMKKEGDQIQTLFQNVQTVTAIMDRRSATDGFITQHSDGTVTERRVNELETIYEEKMKNTLSSRSGRDNISLRFSFANTRCFDALQLCDCLTYMTRKRCMFEHGLENDSDDFLKLWNSNFLYPHTKELTDFVYDLKFNYFRSSI